MKWRLVIRPRAEADLREARDWYESQRVGLGTDFLAEIDTTIQILMRDPQRHPVYYRAFTGYWLGVFPTSCSTEWKRTRSLYFVFYTYAVIILGFFAQGIKLAGKIKTLAAPRART